MEDDAKFSPVGAASNQYYLAKLLLEKYDTFHPFLQEQLQGYTVACCNISLGGSVKLNASDKVVIFDIKTEKKFKMEDKKILAIKKSKVSDLKYKKELKIASTNLKTWTRNLLWGALTKVKVIIDGKEQ
jgi:hypothetical protein